MPTTVEERLEVAKTILRETEKHGIAAEDVIIDVLILPIGADHGTGLTTLRSIEKVSRELGNNTSVGLSNLSFGMPDRNFLNTMMLAMSIQAGLTAAIVDAMQTQIKMAVSGSDMIRGLDTYCIRWIAEFRAREAAAVEKTERRRLTQRPPRPHRRRDRVGSAAADTDDAIGSTPPIREKTSDRPIASLDCRLPDA